MTTPLTDHDTTPTHTWLATTPWLPQLDGPAATAEALLLLVHYGIDWDGWVGDHRTTYWERLLPERVVAAALRSRDLRTWWTLLSRDLNTVPRTAAQRRELEQLLAQPARPVLTVLRSQSEALLLRTRLVADAVRERRVVRVGVER
ncbi:hypothetical protein [Luteococcus sp.]|uniref:hypothetical protein n=1 Tax=Luteococcus sp. TaxID=1969402 RepID=UPI003736C0DD